MAYKTNRFGENVGQDYDISPDPQYGSIKHGPRAPQYRFRAPRAGVRQSFKAPARGPMIDTRLPAGSLLAGAEIGAQAYLGHKAKQQAAWNANQAALNNPNALHNQYQAALNQANQASLSQNNPYAQVWAQSPNNPNAPWNVRPPKGSGLAVPPPPKSQVSPAPSPTAMSLSTTPPPMAGGAIATGPTAIPPAPPVLPSLGWAAPRGKGSAVPPPPPASPTSPAFPPPMVGGTAAEAPTPTPFMAPPQPPQEPSWKPPRGKGRAVPPPPPAVQAPFDGIPLPPPMVESTMATGKTRKPRKKLPESITPSANTRTQKRPPKDVQP